MRENLPLPPLNVMGGLGLECLVNRVCGTASLRQGWFWAAMSPGMCLNQMHVPRQGPGLTVGPR